MFKTLEKLYIYLAIVCLIQSGCRTAKTAVSETFTKEGSVEVRDSSVSRDTLLTLPGDTAKLILALKRDSTNKPINMEQITQTSKNATIRYSIKHDTVTVECDCAPQIAKVTKYYESRLRVVRDSSNTSFKKTTEVPVPYVPLPVKILAYIGAGTVTYLGFRAYKLLNKVI